MRLSRLFLGWLLAGAFVMDAGAAEKLKYNRDVRPILSDKCFQCHGPDAAKRQAELRLDDPKSALEHRDGKAAIIAGDADHSRVYQRLITTNLEEKMPPAESGVTLTAAEIAIIQRWINEGAEYEPHWAFIAPQWPHIPSAANSASVVDAFLQDRLSREGITPAARADRATLIRRATFDLLGLPPDLGAIDEFFADESPDAFERLLDRLFASPRYGERMAMPWMQAARYADTNGYQTDGPRVMWRWRDWVIEAYNRNLPFDQFTIEQLAGDQLPEPDLDQLIATGFNRNHRGNAEGGIIPDEFLVEYIVDRVETTSTVWLGLTLGCCRCHDHKYDPVSQKEFYGLYAYFNQMPELGKTLRNENSPPLIKAPTRDQQRKLVELTANVAAAKSRWDAMAAVVDHAQRDWESALPEADKVDGTVARLLDLRREPEQTAFDGTRSEVIGDVAHVRETDRFAFAAWIEPKDPRPQTVFARMEADVSYRGYELRTVDGKLYVVFAGRILDDHIKVETQDPVLATGRHHVVVTYDATKLATGVKMYVDGVPVPVRIVTNLLSNPFESPTAEFTIGGGGYVEPFIGEISDVRVYKGQLTGDEIAAISVAKPLDQLVAIPVGQRTKSEASKLREYFLTYRAAPEIQQQRAAWIEALANHQSFLEAVPTTMIMKDTPGLRDTHVLIRGEYNRPGEKVETATPKVLPKSDGTNRLALAKWLASPEHPLTSRVTVNRYWSQFFGNGLVSTTEDFGAQGELPTHPELLDWLALEFIRLGWDTKHLQRKMMESAAYQQTARVSPELFARDPDNRLLARGPRFRLTAEMIRDAALATSGLLVEELGGPSVKPYQPLGLWEEVSADPNGPYSKYVPDEGAGLYRRGLYTFWKRTMSPPMMTILDAPTRDMCRVKTSRTNTPLQALNLMNDVTYLEAARVMAEELIVNGGSQPASRIAWAFRSITAREPSADELAVLTKGLERRLQVFQQQPELAQSLLSSGARPVRAELNPGEVAAYATVVGVLLNLDEFVMRE